LRKRGGAGDDGDCAAGIDHRPHPDRTVQITQLERGCGCSALQAAAQRLCCGEQAALLEECPPAHAPRTAQSVQELVWHNTVLDLQTTVSGTGASGQGPTPVAKGSCILGCLCGLVW